MTATPQSTFPTVRTVPPLRALEWLRRGDADIRANTPASLFYGGCFALMGLALYEVFNHATQYITTLAMGFMLIGPVLAIGLYDLSRQHESGTPPRLSPSLTAWRRNPGGIGIFVLMLTVVFLVWARASLVAFALFDLNSMPTWSTFLAELVRFQNLDFLLAFFGVGALFAGIVFVFSCVSIPALLDRRGDAITAAILSVMAVLKNPAAFAIWAAIIVGLIGVGLATAFVGLIFTGPLVGHATWHAYRDLINDPAAPADT